MKPIRISVLILCASFVSVASAQQPEGKCSNRWSEFLRPNMERWKPGEEFLNLDNVSNLGVKWTYTAVFNWSSPAVANGSVYFASGCNIYGLNASTGSSCGATPLATLRIPRPRWRMVWFMSVSGNKEGN